VLVIGAAVAGCATSPSRDAAKVKEADERMVASCQFLGSVQGSSGWGGLAASTGTQNARNEAQEQAARLGATHVVWAAAAGGFAPSAAGRAYRCAQ